MTVWKTVILLATTASTSSINECFFIFVSFYQWNNLCHTGCDSKCWHFLYSNKAKSNETSEDIIISNTHRALESQYRHTNAPFLESNIYQVTSYTSNIYVHSGSTIDIAFCSSSCKIGATSSWILVVSYSVIAAEAAGMLTHFKLP
jgi:hypothetical protein